MLEHESAAAQIRRLLSELSPDKQREVVTSLAQERNLIVTPTAPAALALSPQDYGLDPKEADLALLYAAASKQATGRAADPDSILGILTPQQIATVVEGSTVGRLYRRFRILMRELVLPSGGFTSNDQAEMAGQLVGADRDLRNRLTDLGVDWPAQKHERVLKADSMRVTFSRAQKKLKAIASGQPPPRIGRRPRTESTPHA